MRHLKKINNKWLDVNDGNVEYKGFLTRDLEIGDKFDTVDDKGAAKTVEVKEKTTVAGALIVVSMEV